MKDAPLTRDMRMRLRIAIVVCGISRAGTLPAQTAFDWQQIKSKFEAANPTLKGCAAQYR